MIQQIEVAIAGTAARLDEQLKIRDELQPRIAENEALQKLTQAISDETKKLNEIVELIKQQETQEGIFNDLVFKLAEAFLAYQTSLYIS